MERLAAAPVDVADGGADLGVGVGVDVLFEEVDQPAVALQDGERPGGRGRCVAGRKSGSTRAANSGSVRVRQNARRASQRRFNGVSSRRVVPRRGRPRTPCRTTSLPVPARLENRGQPGAVGSTGDGSHDPAPTAVGAGSIATSGASSTRKLDLRRRAGAGPSAPRLLAGLADAGRPRPVGITPLPRVDAGAAGEPARQAAASTSNGRRRRRARLTTATTPGAGRGFPGKRSRQRTRG